MLQAIEQLLKLFSRQSTRQCKNTFGFGLVSRNLPKTAFRCQTIPWSRRSYSTMESQICGVTERPTIFALSSGGRKCAVGIIRVSGPQSKTAVEKLCKRVPKPRVASVRRLLHPISRDMLDKSLVLWFPGPHSFTGEDCAEFHVHGGPAVISSVLSALGTIPGLVPAQPGQFSKRAFMNDKLDLTEVEGLGDLIHAETEAQRKQALRQMEGDLGKLYSNWRTRLIKSLANVEAFIDFSEEENIEDGVIESVCTEVGVIKDEILSHLKDSRQGERLRDGLHIVILGEPNVGKSSLLNALCQRPAAIVSPIAGTTRDVVDTALDISGYPVLVSDTAGLRETSDQVEMEGVTRALGRARNADLKILVLDWSKHGSHLNDKETSFPNFIIKHMTELGLNSNTSTEDTLVSTDNTLVSRDDTLSSMNEVAEENLLLDLDDDIDPMGQSDVLVVVNKSDLAGDGAVPSFSLTDCSGTHNATFISCQTGHGLDKFLEVLVQRIELLCGNPLTQSASLTQTRHRYHLMQCHNHLVRFDRQLDKDVVLAAEQLRRAARELSLITGSISVEDVLDVIFRDFCIGK